MDCPIQPDCIKISSCRWQCLSPCSHTTWKIREKKIIRVHNWAAWVGVQCLINSEQLKFAFIVFEICFFMQYECLHFFILYYIEIHNHIFFPSSIQDDNVAAPDVCHTNLQIDMLPCEVTFSMYTVYECVICIKLATGSWAAWRQVICKLTEKQGWTLGNNNSAV